MIWLSILLSCSGEREDIEFSGELSACDPLDEGLCAFPFPSMFYMQENAEQETGWQVNFREGSLPTSANDVPTNPKYWNEKDGFSSLSPIMTHFPELSLDGVIGHDQLEAYLSEDVKTVIIDVETGERIPHFVELDMSHDQSDRRALILRPVVPMEWGHRHVVGMRGLLDTSGAEIEPSDAFKALRDDSYTKNYDIEGRRSSYEELIFPTLDTAGFSRGELQIAWDFVVASKQGTVGKAVWMRDDLFSRLPDGGPTYIINKVEEFSVEENTDVIKRIYGTMSVPYYTEVPESGSLLSRDENGWPYYVGETEREFTVIVPRSLWEEGISGPIVQYGHGLMGSQGEVEGGYLGRIANRYGYVLLAVDWSGMSTKDLDNIMLMIVNEIENFAMIPERSQQGFVEFLAAERMLNGNLSQDAELMTIDSEGQPISVVDTERSYFYGNSQGGILGTSYLALSPNIDRGVLGVSGGPYSILLTRSVDFDSYFMLLKTMYPDYMEISLWLGLMQTLWDAAEPSGYLDSFQRDPLPGNNPKEALIQVGIGDAQVTTLGAHIQARGIGAGLVNDPVRPVWGLEELEDGAVGSGLVEWDYGIEEPFMSVPPSGETDPHGRVRNELAAQDQLHHFFSTGELINTCGGPCQDIED